MGTVRASEKLAEGKRVPRWQRVWRPFAAWFLLVVVMVDYRTHQRLAQETHLDFSVSLEGRLLQGDASTTLDGQPIATGDRVPLGRHEFTVSHPKGDSYSTNLFILYGEYHLGTINLKRSKGTLLVSALPPARLITIQGPEFSLRLTNSTGITTNVPMDRYTVEVSYAHWRQMRQTDVQSTLVETCAFAPQLGTVELKCNQSDASFQIFDAKDQLVEGGDLPAWVFDMPQGNYKLIGWHHKNRNEQRLVVKAGITNSIELEFLYGAALLETDPSGASIVTPDGHDLGVTPRLLSELPVGRWQFQLRLAGYSPMAASVDVIANQTNPFSANLVSINYIPAMNAARRQLAAGDYERAINAARDALQVKPNDPEATSLEREAVGKGHVRRAESLGKRGDYIGAGKELETALESIPDNEEAKQLRADFKTREPAQREQLQQERLKRGKRLFDSVMAEIRDADLFESHELKTGKSAKEAQAAILNAFRHGNPILRVKRSQTPQPELFEIVAEEELYSGLIVAGLRRCVIVGGQTRDDETRVLYKVLEYKTKHNVTVQGFLNLTDTRELIPIHRSRIPEMTDKLRAQLNDGVTVLTERLEKALGQ